MATKTDCFFEASLIYSGSALTSTPFRRQEMKRRVSTSSTSPENLPLSIQITIMLLILDNNSEMGAHIRSNICHLICLRHFFRSRAVTNSIFFRQIHCFFCMQVEKIRLYNEFKFYQISFRGMAIILGKNSTKITPLFEKISIHVK